MEFGDILKQLRKQRGLSVRDLQQLLGFATPQAIALLSASCAFLPCASALTTPASAASPLPTVERIGRSGTRARYAPCASAHTPPCAPMDTSSAS